jgi:uncharacterized integral membrane protein
MGSVDAGLSGPSTSASATSSTGPVTLNLGGSSANWTLIIVAALAAVFGLLFVLKGKRRK